MSLNHELKNAGSSHVSVSAISLFSSTSAMVAIMSPAGSGTFRNEEPVFGCHLTFPRRTR